MARKHQSKTVKTNKRRSAVDAPVARTAKQKPVPTAENETTPLAGSLKLPASWQIAARAGRVLRTHWKIFTGIGLMYLLAQLFLVRSVSGISDVSLVRQLFEDSGLGGLAGSLGGFVLLVGSTSGSSDSASNAYNLIITAITSLAAVWALRQALAGVPKLRIRDAYYKGMHPLIPVLLVLLLVCIETIPLLMASSLFSTMIIGGVATALLEKVAWIALILLLGALSLFLLSSSLFALYIATLTDMTPVAALRSAVRLVKYRRFSILRKLLFLPVHILLLLALVIVPVIHFAAPVASWLLFILTAPVLIYVHAYMYVLYKELLPR